jgi:RNA polymerase sigma-70 factor, ECF subfamily
MSAQKSAPTPRRRGPTGEEALVARLRAGDEQAFEELVNEHGPRLYAMARRLLASDEDARDVLQEAFLAAFRSIHRFEGASTLSTWLHRIVINAAITRLRQRRRSEERSIEDLLPSFRDDGHGAEPAIEWGETARSAPEREETRELVRRSIDLLPESYRTVLLLRDIEQLDTAETARLLDVNVNTVKVRLHRARQALRSLLDVRFRESLS